MITNNIAITLKKLWGNNRINYSIRIFISLLGVALPCWLNGITQAITPLILGVFASALAETENTLSERVKSLIITLLSFSIATYSVTLLYPYPLLFTLGLFTSTFGFIMLGAIGPRYASISFGSLIIAIYTMLLANNLNASPSSLIWGQSHYLLLGASWYGAVSLLWLFFWPFQAIKENLSTLFKSLSDALDQNNEAFSDPQTQALHPFQIHAAKTNALVVNDFNKAKMSLLRLIRQGSIKDKNQDLLNMYFIAQDIHEKINAFHSEIPQIKNAFIHSDVVFRVQKLLQLQAKACLNISWVLRLKTQYQHNDENKRALKQLQDSVAYIQSRPEYQGTTSVLQLESLLENLTTIELLLLDVCQSRPSQEDKEIADSQPQGFVENILQIKSQFTLKSLLFRHAIRLSVTLCCGYGIIQAFEFHRGYWILLTILFVCQSNYSDTHSKLTQRISGTVLGLLVGFPLLVLFPDLNGQLFLMLIFGVLFFAFRNTHYTSATAFITLLVLMSFNQFGEGYSVILPRLRDTLIGCFLAVIAARFILPDWHAHRLRGIMKDSLTANREYLAQIIPQYKTGSSDTVTYRVARRKAHNEDALLSTAIQNMLIEPGRYRVTVEESFRFLCLNHAMLSNISALGAHRVPVQNPNTFRAFCALHLEIQENLNRLIEKIAHPDMASDQELAPLQGPAIEELNASKTEKKCSLKINPCADKNRDAAKNNSDAILFEPLNLIHSILLEMNQVSSLLLENTLNKSKT